MSVKIKNSQQPKPICEENSKRPAFPFQVICEHCRKTISFSGENGEVFPVVCDRCSGLE